MQGEVKPNLCTVLAGQAGTNGETPAMTPAASREYYYAARKLGLCGRCKQADALAGMAYCLKCRTAMQGYNHARKGPPKKVYESKFARTSESNTKGGTLLIRDRNLVKS